VRVGWLADSAGVLGGAELTSAEFRAAAPDGVEVVDCPHGAVIDHLDIYVVQNCVQYTLDDFRCTGIKRIVKYWHDVGVRLLLSPTSGRYEHRSRGNNPSTR
jgi:hypothetical protein